MDGTTFLNALLEAKQGATVIDKRSRSPQQNKPGRLTFWFSDGSEVSFTRAEVNALKTEEQMAAFIQRLIS